MSLPLFPFLKACLSIPLRLHGCCYRPGNDHIDQKKKFEKIKEEKRKKKIVQFVHQ